MNTEWIRHHQMDLASALDMNALAQAGYQYVWYQEQSRVGICVVADYRPDADRLIEARIFSNAGDHDEAREVHVFAGSDGVLKAVETIAAGNAAHSDENQLLLPRFGKSLTVRTVYTYDEDGQAMPGAFLLTGYERG